MGEIIKFKQKEDNKQKLEQIFARNQELMDDEFLQELNELQTHYMRFKPDRLKVLLLIEKMLHKSVSGYTGTKRGMGNILPGMCTIGITGKKLDIINMPMFHDALLLATCLEVIPRINGEVTLDISLYDMDQDIDWDKCACMLLEYNPIF